MKKIFFIGLLAISAQSVSFAQWTPTNTASATTNIRYDANVGIGTGTTTPAATLHINTSTSRALYFTRGNSAPFGLEIASGIFGLYDYTLARYIWRATSGNLFLAESGGNVGIGTTDPTTRLSVNGANTGSETITLDNTSSTNKRTTLVRYGSTGGGDYWTGLNSANTGSLGADGLFVLRSTGGLVFSGSYAAEHMRVNTLGNVLIGKTTQVNAAYKLDVNGGVRANSIVVNTTGADFVFAKNYRLRPLSEVESFIQANHHLPEIAPAAQMQAEGVSVGELQTQLLQKVEELTLYLIEQNKQLEAQNEKIQVLEEKLSQSKK
jgi:hypothetical protein